MSEPVHSQTISTGLGHPREKSEIKSDTMSACRDNWIVMVMIISSDRRVAPTFPPLGATQLSAGYRSTCAGSAYQGFDDGCAIPALGVSAVTWPTCSE